MYTENSIVIKGGLEEVFSVVWDVEKYTEFIPQFKETKVVMQNDNRRVIERKIKIGWLYSSWRSEMVIKKNESIKFVHLTGLLRGMETEWIFEEKKEGIEIKTVHNFKVKLPIVGEMISFLLWNAFIKRTAMIMLNKIKKRIEKI